VAVIGEQELASGQIRLKNMMKNEQVETTLNNIETIISD
jgi:histidyl-tRNA synthetase